MRKRGKSKAVSLRDLADALNISTAAASRALNDLPGVGAELRARVKEEAARLGYVKYLRTSMVNAYERSMKLVAVVYGAIGGNLIGPIERGIASALRTHGYHELRFMVDPARELPTETARRVFFDRLAAEKGVVGVATCYLRLSDVLLQRLYQAGMPVVMMEHASEFGRCVTIDQERAAHRATRHLALSGRKRIGCILPAEDEAPVWRQRLDGYRKALRERRLSYSPARIVHPDWVSVDMGEKATCELMQNAPDTDGILYGTDTLAAGGIHALRMMGKRIPADIAVIGFDDDEFAPVLVPPLSSVRQPIERMARTALHLLIESIDKGDKSARSVTLDTELILRESCPGHGLI